MKDSTYCWLPFVNLTLDTGGDLKFCCASDATYSQVTSEDNLLTAWESSEQMNSLRSKMILGQADANICKACIKNEKQNLSSKRIRYKDAMRKNQNSKNGVPLIEEDSPQIIDMDLSFSRTCNLQCATCDSRFSSKWFSDDKKRIELGINVTYEDISHLRGQNPKLKDSQVEQLIQIANKGSKITIKGGEPFLDPNFKKFILGLDASMIHSLTCVTNGTIYDEELLEQILKIKRLNFTFSIDGSKEIHKWIRVADENHYSNLSRNMSRVHKCEINSVLSAFNIFTIDKFIEELLEEKSFEITNFYLHSVAQRSFETPLVFSFKYRNLMAEKIKTSMRLIEKSANRDLAARMHLENFRKMQNFIETGGSSDQRENTFLIHYDKILLPRRGRCLSEVDSTFGDALTDLRKRLQLSSSAANI